VVTDPTPIIPGLYCTGNIERVTGYEKMSTSLLVQRGQTIEQDDFRGEQALLFSVRGKGLVVLSGCAHAGIVNTVKQAVKIAGVKKVHAILGGFHLINAEPEIVQQTIADIRALGPDLIAPTHCTGFEAVAAFAREMPAAFNLNTAGTQYIF
jgi:7,8-dihydropterin-6-yl-methyl-4-(beta-D-ribofuranosyl)aminobenzene 5'-phosphate synthase